MAGSGDGLDIIRIFFNPAAGHEEGNFNVVLRKNIENPGGVLIPPRRIKTKCNLRSTGIGTAVNAVDREELVVRMRLYKVRSFYDSVLYEKKDKNKAERDEKKREVVMWFVLLGFHRMILQKRFVNMLC